MNQTTDIALSDEDVGTLMLTFKINIHKSRGVALH
jgi:hypothetical protein